MAFSLHTGFAAGAVLLAFLTPASAQPPSPPPSAAPARP